MVESLALTVELCGKLADPCGREVRVSLPPGNCSVADLIALLSTYENRLGELVRKTRIRVCVNDELVKDTVRIAPGDRVALFPPVSGG